MKLIKLFRNAPLNIFIAQVDYHNGEGEPDLRNWYMEFDAMEDKLFSDMEGTIFQLDGTIYEGPAFEYVEQNLERMRSTAKGEAMVRTLYVLNEWSK